MYAPGKVLVMRGDSPGKNTAEVIDLNAASPGFGRLMPTTSTGNNAA